MKSKKTKIVQIVDSDGTIVGLGDDGNIYELRGQHTPRLYWYKFEVTFYEPKK